MVLHCCGWKYLSIRYFTSKSYVKPFLVAKTHTTNNSPTAICDINDDRKQKTPHNMSGRKQIDPLNFGLLGGPLGRDN